MPCYGRCFVAWTANVAAGPSRCRRSERPRADLPRSGPLAVAPDYGMLQAMAEREHTADRQSARGDDGGAIRAWRLPARGSMRGRRDIDGRRQGWMNICWAFDQKAASGVGDKSWPGLESRPARLQGSRSTPDGGRDTSLLSSSRTESGRHCKALAAKRLWRKI